MLLLVLNVLLLSLHHCGVLLPSPAQLGQWWTSSSSAGHHLHTSNANFSCSCHGTCCSMSFAPRQRYYDHASVCMLCMCSVVIVRTQNTDSSPDFLLQSRSSLDGEPWWERAAAARRMSIDVNTCRVCQKPTTTQCGTCKSVKYW